MVTRTRRTNERGAAMFVVLMVILILSAIGTFALTNARYEVQAAGFSRYRGISQEVAQLGGAAAMAEVGGNKVSTYLTLMRNNKASICKANQGIVGAPCWHILARDIEARPAMGGEKLFRAPVLASKTPGSLGLNTLTGGFDVQLTEPTEIPKPIAGFNLQTTTGAAGGGNAPTIFIDITVTSVGVVFDDANGNGAIDYTAGEGSSAVFTEGRGHIFIGPLLQTATAGKAPTTTT